jgi:hypothetical protein
MSEPNQELLNRIMSGLFRVAVVPLAAIRLLGASLGGGGNMLLPNLPALCLLLLAVTPVSLARKSVVLFALTFLVALLGLAVTIQEAVTY